MLTDLLTTLEAGDARSYRLTTPAASRTRLGIAEALRQERGNPMAVVYARLALFARRDLAEAALLIGDIMAEQENLEAAIEAYQAVAPDSPLSFLAELRRARALHDMEHQGRGVRAAGETGDGRAGADRCAGPAGRSAAPRRSLRRVRAGLQPGDRADRPSGPEHWTLFYARGITYERTKRWPQAETDFL